MRYLCIVTLMSRLALVFCALGLAAVGTAPVLCAEEEAPDKHLDPLETITRFVNLVQSGKSGDLKTAAKLIDPDRGDQAWANDQLDSSTRELLLSMRVYNFASIFTKDPVAGQPVYAVGRAVPGTADATGAGAKTTTPEVTEASADRATVLLASGRSIAFAKNAMGVWLLVEYSSSLAARADWAATRDRDLDLPPAGQFKDFSLDMAKHDADYAWRVAMALGEAGRFAELSRLIALPPSGEAAPEGTAPAPATAGTVVDPKMVREREAFLAQQGRLLYSWLRHSMPLRVRKEPSGIARPASEPADSDLPVAEGQVANFVIWTNDRKRVRLVVQQRETPEGSLGLAAAEFEWRFDSDSYSAETKRAWIHSQRQQLPDQP
ncbi:MAG TPA: hypothetical protein VL860_03285 [Planctomycetota bacterium]|nr:hypothetical protein [Planctomycetota bacterium]